MTRPHHPPKVALRWPLGTAAIKSGGLLLIAITIAFTGNIIDNSNPNGTGPGSDHGLTRLLLLVAVVLVVTALVIAVRAVAASLRRGRSGGPRLP